MLFNLANEVPISIWYINFSAYTISMQYLYNNRYDWHDDGTDPNNQEDNFGTTLYVVFYYFTII